MTHRPAQIPSDVISSAHRLTSPHMPRHRPRPGSGRDAVKRPPAKRQSAKRPPATRPPGKRQAAKRQPAKRKLGRYQLVRRLHKGRVTHLMQASVPGIGGVERTVAVKFLRSRFARDRRAIDSFLHEERVTGSLQHPNVVNMLDSGESEYGPYMVLEHIKGWNLAELSCATRASGQRIPLDVALSIAYGIASGLTYLHDLLGDRDQRVHIVHRDVRPENVMVTENGCVKLIDFGDVTIEGMERESPMLAGVSQYTPPEMTTQGNIDRRGDIYSLGILMYELTTGQSVRRDEHSGRLVPPSALCPDYPQDLEDLIMSMCHLDPEKRLKSVATLQFAFEDFAGNHRIPLSQRHVAQFARRIMDRPGSAARKAAPTRQEQPAPRHLDRADEFADDGRTRVHLREFAPRVPRNAHLPRGHQRSR